VRYTEPAAGLVRSCLPCTSSEASVPVLRAEEHFVNEGVHDQIQEQERGPASDGCAERRDSGVEVDHDLEGVEHGHFHPDGGPDRVGHHVLDAAVLMLVLPPGLCIDPVHPGRRVKVGAEGPQHVHGEVGVTVWVDGDGDNPTFVLVEPGDLSEYAVSTETKVVALVAIEPEHLDEVEHPSSLCMRPLTWPDTSRLTSQSPSQGDEVDHSLSPPREHVCCSDVGSAQVDQWSLLLLRPMVVRLTSYRSTVELGTHAGFPKSIRPVDVSVHPDNPEVCCRLCKTKTALDQAPVDDDWVQKDHRPSDLRRDHHPPEPRAAFRMSLLVNCICWRPHLCCPGPLLVVDPHDLDLEEISDQHIGRLHRRRNLVGVIPHMSIFRLRIVHCWRLLVDQDRVSNHLPECGTLVSLVTEAAVVTYATPEVKRVWPML
jgi:hypothetical protein